jgi:hypothetical protein
VHDLIRRIGYLMMICHSFLWGAAQGARNAHTPPRAIFFYGYPSLVNGAQGNVALASQVFASYEIMFWAMASNFQPWYRIASRLA